jgi:hypothetical protein
MDMGSHSKTPCSGLVNTDPQFICFPPIPQHISNLSESPTAKLFSWQDAGSTHENIQETWLCKVEKVCLKWWNFAKEWRNTRMLLNGNKMTYNFKSCGFFCFASSTIIRAICI